ncbi:MAG: hypothetical protein KF700_09410 [Hyphomonadaceae bacterium]|nr:hypothetical protein [Hyphomonadaceae bacterium]
MSPLVELAGSAAAIALMVGAAAVLGFRASAKLDEAELARLADAEHAAIRAAAIDAKGRSALALLDNGKLLAAKVMADGVSARVAQPEQVRLRARAGKLHVTFGDVGYPSLHMKLAEPPPWLAELAGGTR